MPAAIYDVHLAQADTVPYELVWQETESGPPIDLSGVTARLEIDDRIGGATVLLSTANGGVLPLAADGLISIQTAHANFSALAAGQYRYRLILTYPSGDWTLMAGKLVLS
ncbi:MAG: hypothetical protein WC073_10860 [Sterolibacterium sp.]